MAVSVKTTDKIEELFVSFQNVFGNAVSLERLSHEDPRAQRVGSSFRPWPKALLEIRQPLLWAKVLLIQERFGDRYALVVELDDKGRIKVEFGGPLSFLWHLLPAVTIVNTRRIRIENGAPLAFLQYAPVPRAVRLLYQRAAELLKVSREFDYLVERNALFVAFDGERF
jgi:hypothetical protein